MADADTVGYALGRGYNEATRLGFQHFLWKETLDYLLHPSIPSNSASLRIADVGAGSGIWLLDLAKRLPSATLDGYDISARQYPPNEWIPNNVKLHIVDATRDPPQHLQGYYDIVHIRLFLSIVENNNPSRILNHCLKLLKPGGYLQWEEHDFNGQEVICANPLTPSDSTAKLMGYKLKIKPFNWVSRLPVFLEERGVEAVQVDRQPQQPCHRRMWTELELAVGEEFAQNFVDKKGPPGSGDELRNLISSAYTEVRQGAAIPNILQVVVGRKRLWSSTEA